MAERPGPAPQSGARPGLGVLMVCHGHPEVTTQAVRAVIGQLLPQDRLWVLDNAAGRSGEEVTLDPHPALRVIASATNTGFAGGMNRLVALALEDGKAGAVVLVNNDALVGPGGLAALAAAWQRARRDVLVAGRMMRWRDRDQVDSLGISLYRSGLASNRLAEDARLLGPTGGFMLLPRAVVDDLRGRHGELFDESFFCYAEDTDLAMRARWLGHDCIYARDAVALHHGSLSSGGPDNEFVLYHGIRNSIWALAKNAPALWLVAHLPWIVLAHGGIWLRNLRKGRWRTLLRLYRDALLGLPGVLRKRVVVRRARRVPARRWWDWVEPRLYERGYLVAAWRELWRGPRR